MAAAGFAIDYVGGSAVTLIGPGEAAGNFREIEIQNAKIVDVNYR
jgi:branched-chain amino acid transport system substrate-binding protein